MRDIGQSGIMVARLYFVSLFAALSRLSSKNGPGYFKSDFDELFFIVLLHRSISVRGPTMDWAVYEDTRRAVFNIICATE